MASAPDHADVDAAAGIERSPLDDWCEAAQIEGSHISDESSNQDDGARLARAMRCLDILEHAWKNHGSRSRGRVGAADAAIPAGATRPLIGTPAAGEAVDEADVIIGSAPQRLGRFEILSRIGSGAHGIVYLAHDPVLKRAADVYALGATLYESLTGQAPFHGQSAWETFLQVREGRMIPPRRLMPSIPRDLEAICSKCLEYDPRRRYASAETLAQDLRRFLARQPISARPTGQVRKCAKWCRRQPLAAALTFLLIACITFGFAGVAWQWRRAEQQKRLADTNFRHAHQAIRGLHDVFMSENRLADPGFEELHHEVLRLSLKYYRQLGQSSHGNYELDEDTADTCYRLAHSSLAAGDPESAVQFCLQAIPMWEGLAGAFSAKLDYLYFLAKTHRVLAQAHARLNATPAEVLGHINAAVEIDEELVNQRTANGVYRSALADSLLLASVQHRRLGDVKTARGLVDRALELRLLAVEGDPQNPMLRRELADAFYHSAVAAFSERLADGNFEAVHEASDRAIALYRTLAAQGFSEPTTSNRLARCYRMCGKAATATGGSDLALEYFLQEAAVLEAMLQRFPEHSDSRDALKTACGRIAELYQARGDQREAIEFRTKSGLIE